MVLLNEKKSSVGIQKSILEDFFFYLRILAILSDCIYISFRLSQKKEQTLRKTL